ncbi:MFS transporter [Micromonospora fulviviridis]|uniref:MFS transporter n=1 Tax=Micromonospora fulviviridis TaxID=47860 RepID=A0ABV2VW39_9ACTN
MTLEARYVRDGTTRRLKRSRYAVASLFFLLGFGFGSWAVRIPDIQNRFGLSKAVLGMALFALAIGSLIGMPLAGFLAARFDGARLTRACAVTLAVMIALPPFSLGLPGLAVVLCLFGAANGALGVTMNTQASALERLLGRPVLSSCHGVFSIGGLLGSLSSGAIATAGLPVTVHLPIVSLALLALSVSGGPYLIPTEPAQRSPAFSRPSRALLAFGVLAFCVLFAEGSVTDWSAVYLREHLLASPVGAAMGYSGFAMAMALGRLSGDRLATAWGPRRLVQCAGTVAVLGSASILLAPAVWLAVVGFALLGAGLSVIFPIALSGAARRNETQPSSAIAAVSTVGYLGFLLGPPLIGFLAQLTNLRGSLLIMLLCAAAVLPLSLALRGRRVTG